MSSERNAATLLAANWPLWIYCIAIVAVPLALTVFGWWRNRA